MLLKGTYCLSQEVEFCGSLSNSFNEPRLQNALGIGIQYQHDINQKFKIGFGIHYNNVHANFHEETFNITGTSGSHWVNEIKSKYNRVSCRLNIQGILKENESVSISLGPEISYNFLWGQDNTSSWNGGPQSQRGWYINYNDLLKKIGFGIIAEIEIKNFINSRLSLCSKIRPELIYIRPKSIYIEAGDYFVLPRTLELIEFQIGLKYRFKEL